MLGPHPFGVVYFVFMLAATALAVAGLCLPLMREDVSHDTRTYIYYWQYVVKTQPGGIGYRSRNRNPTTKVHHHFGNSYSSYSQNPLPLNTCKATWNKLRAAFAFNIMAVIACGFGLLTELVFMASFLPFVPFVPGSTSYFMLIGWAAFAVICWAITIPIDISLYTLPHCGIWNATFENLQNVAFSSGPPCMVASIFCTLVALGCAIALYPVAYKQETALFAQYNDRQPVMTSIPRDVDTVQKQKPAIDF